MAIVVGLGHDDRDHRGDGPADLAAGDRVERKFKFEQVESTERVSSPLLHLLTNSNALARSEGEDGEPASERIYTSLARRRRVRVARPARAPRRQVGAGYGGAWLVCVVAVVGCFAA